MALADRDLLKRILRCPTCAGPLRHHDERIRCRSCRQRGCWLDGAAVLFSESLPATFYDPEYTGSNGYGPASRDLIQRCEGGLVLDLGAGQPPVDYPQVVQTDIRLYRGTDVVTAHERLPFADDTFDGVISQAVIEHVTDPWQHVQEILRTLKPGGQVVLDAAFLQPLHGAPHHYFNTARPALELLFRDFAFSTIEVAPYQHPWHALRWLLRSYRQGLPGEGDRAEFDRLTMAELQDRFARADEGALGCLLRLSPDAEVELAAGFRVIASKGHGPRPRRTGRLPALIASLTRPRARPPARGEDVPVDVPRLAQTDAAAHTGELRDSNEVTQSFFLDRTISRVDVMFATFMRRNSRDVVFRLAAGGGAAPVERTVSAAELVDNAFHTFVFPPQASRDGWWQVSLSSPDSAVGDCVTVRCSGHKRLSQGELRINGQRVDRDLTFRAYTRAVLRT